MPFYRAYPDGFCSLRIRWIHPECGSLGKVALTNNVGVVAAMGPLPGPPLTGQKPTISIAFSTPFSGPLVFILMANCL